MKIKIIKQNKILKEGAKGASDWPSDTKLLCKDSGDKIVFEFSGSLEGYLVLSKLKTEGLISCKAPGKTLFYVADVDTTKAMGAKKPGIGASGWGPLLYDVAIEYINKNHNGALVSDRERVSGAAKKVWDFYLNKRSDIKKIKLDINQETIEYYSGKKSSVGLQHLTPSKSDDCTQISSVEWAAGSGDWMDKKFKNSVKRRKVALSNPELAKKWNEQSTSFAYYKEDTKILDELGDRFINI